MVDRLGRLGRSRALLAGSLATSFLSALAAADTRTLDLKSLSSFSTADTTALINTVEGRVQAPPAAGGTAGKELSFGDGSDGEFNDGPAQTGITVSGSTISIDTDSKATFQFTAFTLGSGKTLRVTGSKALRLRVRGTVTISGTIDASGTAGTLNSLSAAATGGTAGAGGTAGGLAGFAAGGLPVSGAAAGTDSLGGIKGTNSAVQASVKGAGGGCIGVGADAAEDAAGSISWSSVAGADGGPGTCATTRATVASALESTFTGGAGGGGGGSFTGGTPASGGGGGGGGGAIGIAAVGAITLSGTLNVAGGTGGDNTTLGGAAFNRCGGAGGGGAGGTVWLQTPATLTSSGTVNVSGGAAAGATACAGAQGSGRGSRGVFRVDTPSGSATVSTSPTSIADSFQTVRAVSGQTYVALSKAIDFSTTWLTFSTPTETAGCGTDGTLAVSYEGSSDGTTFGSGVAAAQLSTLSDSLYLRVRVTITTTGANPPCLTALSIPYELHEVSKIALKGGLACGTTSKPGATPVPWIEMALLGLALLTGLRPSARRF